jgi:hypothetical protein
MLAYFLLCQAQFKPWQVGGVGEIEIKTKLSPAEAGVWAELGKIPKIVATFVYASSQGQRTHSTRTNSLIDL